MSRTERDLVSRLLKQSILAVCREALSYTSRLEVDGIVCVTVDNQTDHVIKIHEFLSKPQSSNRSSPDSHFDDGNSNSSSLIKHEKLQSPTRVAVKTEPVEPSNNRESITISIPQESAPARTVDRTEKQNVKEQTTYLSFTDTRTSTSAKLEVSQSKNISCKKCNAVLEDAKEFESHNLSSHGHFTCLVCLATFTSRNNMKRHLRLHTGVKPYTCQKCSESFARNDDYKRHLLRHTFDKPFRCAICRSGYSDRSCVKNHMVKEHKSKIFHICPQCGESYIDANQFQLHKKTHPEFQDYRCALCSFTGSNSLMYNKHMLTHGTPKRYMCAHCELPFNDPFVYTNHMKRHKGDELVQLYNCCFCDHVSATYEQFQRHEHSHILSKQHTCNVCEKQFRYPSNLREHMLTHSAKPTSERPTVTDSGANKETATHEVMEDSEMENNEDDQEENNEFEQMDEEKPPSVDTIESNGSDYWCTECNQGFGTEDLLQDHIVSTHEDFEEMTEAPANTQTEEEINPYELNTQVDSPFGSAYEGETQGDLLATSPERNRDFDEETVVDEPIITHTGRTKKGYSADAYKEDTQSALTKTKRTLKVFEEETVVDVDDRFQDDEDSNLPRISSGMELSTDELSIVKDAMRQVEEIQSRFGIKPSLKAAHSSLQGTSSRPNLALKGQVGTTGLRNQSTGIWKSPVSINRNRLWNSPQLDINRNDIPSGAVTDSRLNIPLTVTTDGLKLKVRRETNTAPPSNRNGVYDTQKDNGAVVDNDSSGSGQQYSKTSVLGMDTEFSTTPNRGSPTTLNLKARTPGFEKVVTPSVLFKERAPFTCEICEETFLEFESFDQHGIAIHRRYICSYCGKAFTSRPNRERHVRYHTGEKPYKCDICPVSFYRGDDLKYHRTTKHADIRPFLCGTCKTSFALPKELEKHLRVYPDHRMSEKDS